ncbi:LAME_0H12112g1_1 [Lachancea meyersii CBS 8951]|uniref:Transcription initiation factor IIA subunit 2 n=1 Tax=Lachancea meyersii CBS 8951 TaxID=1266667 RepID=A0A1G4KGJ9_9SACH|nr:LAME_0H12112g1_1 [Lachancea meyersii CBS 8951]
MSTSGYYELYRRSTVGATLVDALDTLISDGRIEASLAMKVLGTFDRVVAETLKDKTQSKLTFKGHLDTYRFCDDVWTFIIKNCSVKLEQTEDAQGNTVVVDKVRIVACNSKKTGEQ